MERILEPTEEIEGKIADDYMKFAKWRLPTYVVVAYDIYERLGTPFNGRILEVGCAGGLLVNELHKLYPASEIIGIDVSERMIKSAQQEFGTLSNVGFEKSSVYSLPYDGDSFDLVVCQGSLHHFSDPERAVREILRVVNPAGLIYVQDLRRDVSEERIKQKLNAMTDEYQKERELTSIRASLTKNEIDQMMKRLGITNYKFKSAIFSQQNLAKNRVVIESAKFNEIHDMGDLEFILWLEKAH